MADEAGTTTEDSGTTADASTTPATTGQGDPADLGDAGQRAIAAERNARKAAEREAAAFKARLDEFEAAKLSDLEKATKRAEEAEQRLARLEGESVRSRVALAKGLSPELAARLTGSTEDELSADADALLALIGPRKTTPEPDPTQGGTGKPAGNSTRDAFADALDGLL